MLINEDIGREDNMQRVGFLHFAGIGGIIRLFNFLAVVDNILLDNDSLSSHLYYKSRSLSG